jgi:hypothetical protein
MPRPPQSTYEHICCGQVQSRDSTEEPLISHVADLFIGARTQAMAWLPSARDDPDNTHIALAVASADHRYYSILFSRTLTRACGLSPRSHVS